MRRSIIGSLLALSCVGALAFVGCNDPSYSGDCSFLRENCGSMDASGVDSSNDGAVSGIDGSFQDGGMSDATVGDGGPHADGSSSHDSGLGDATPKDGGVDTGPACDGGLSYCSGLGCVSLETTTNCGVCGTSCATPGGGIATCVEADASAIFSCSATCMTSGETYCGEDAGCVNLSSSSSNCGTCGHACTVPAHGASDVCSASGCVLTCASGYHACFGNCESNGDVPADAAATDPCVVSNEFGVFVSPGGNASGDGGMGAPYNSLTQAMQAAKIAGKRVYACSGTYPTQTVTADTTSDGVTVYGGLNCATLDDAGAWPWTGVPSVISSGSNTFALNVGALSTGIEFDDFSFVSSDALQSVPTAAAGASSIAAIVNSGPGPVTFRRVAFTAGKGQPGAIGTNGVNSLWSGTATNGNNADGSVGGTTLWCACGGSGGGGGYAAIATGFEITTAGENGFDGTPVGNHNGGIGVPLDAGTSPACTSGTVGNPGSPGNGGAGTPDASGTLGATGWTPPAAASVGVAGAFAQGGGGGGGYYYPVSAPSPYGGGGGGGCGGCGGAFGMGGYAGGASIALAVISSPVTLDTCTLNASNGGAGGAGGNGVSGQIGGDAGVSSAGSGGCNGGPGGTGGSGGGGGGGAGGASIGLAYTGTAPSGSSAPHVAPAASGGVAGAGGTPASNGQGAPGLSAGTHAF